MVFRHGTFDYSRTLLCLIRSLSRIAYDKTIQDIRFILRKKDQRGRFCTRKQGNQYSTVTPGQRTKLTK